MRTVINLCWVVWMVAQASSAKGIGMLKTLTESMDTGNASNLTKYLNETKWNDLFPNRYGLRLKDSVYHFTDFYSFNTFVLAAKRFPDFLGEGDTNTQKRELAAFLA